MEKILEIKDLGIRFKTDDGIVNVVNGVTLELKKGEVLGLVGETGAGKTTTALAIMRLIQIPPGEIYEGSILFEGREILNMSDKEMQQIRGDKISMIFQDPMTSLNPVRTVGEQIAEVIRLHQKVSAAEAMKKACEMLEMVGIPAERSGEYPHQFSGGMKQRVIIAIALACRPDLLIADEPTTALDVTIQAQVMDLMENLKKEFGTSMILITHDLGVVAEICDKVAIIYAGEILEYGTLDEIYNHTAHPYTQGLFDSVPDLDEDVRRLKPIDGLMPDPTNLPAGCKFAPRCARCTERCKTTHPDMTVLNEAHGVRCFAALNREG